MHPVSHPCPSFELSSQSSGESMMPLPQDKLLQGVGSSPKLHVHPGASPMQVGLHPGNGFPLVSSPQSQFSKLTRSPSPQISVQVLRISAGVVAI